MNSISKNKYTSPELGKVRLNRIDDLMSEKLNLTDHI